MVEPAQDLLDLGSGHEMIAGGEAERRDQGEPINGEAHHPRQRLRSDADDEERGQTDKAGGDPKHVDAAVGHALADGVVRKIGDAVSDPAHVISTQVSETRLINKLTTPCGDDEAVNVSRP